MLLRVFGPEDRDGEICAEIEIFPVEKLISRMNR